MSHVERALSLEEFLKRPETEPASEYVDGEVARKVSPKGKHSRLQGTIVQRINDFSEPTRLGLALPELRCTFAGRSLVFDVAFFQWRRIGFEPSGEVPDDFFLAPDLAVEIVSPGQRATDVGRKLSWCVKHGVTLGWLIQPRRRQVRVYRSGRACEILSARQMLRTGDVLPGYSCSVDELFGWLRPGIGS
jgi:Uma2 family endonuclease